MLSSARRLVLLAPLLLGGCHESLNCKTPAVVERLSVKLDREMREDPRFLSPHEPDRSRFSVAGIRQEGVDDGAFACAAAFTATLDASPAYARRHGFAAPDTPLHIERTVRFTAHGDGWDTYVEVLSLDVLQERSPDATTKVAIP